MILPIGHEETTVRRRPWVTFWLLGLCTLALILTDVSADPEVYYDWGLIPKHPTVSGLLTHMFVHGGWGHLIGNLLILFLAGPPLEDRWGRPFFAGFYVVGGIFAGGFYTLMTPGSSVPMVGASGAIAALMGASLVRFWSTKIQFLYFFWIFRVIRGTFWVPAWAILPLWFFDNLFMARLADEMGVVSGVAYWCHVGGFVFGVAFAWAMRHWQIEGRYINPAIESRVTVKDVPLIDEAMELRLRGRPEEAYKLLADAARARCDDPDIVSAFWELACELQRSNDAVRLMLGVVNQCLVRGDGGLAAQLWEEIAERAPSARADRQMLLRLIPALLAKEKQNLCVQALRRVVDPRLGELTTAQAFRVLELAKDVDAPTALVAARSALKGGMDVAKRDRLEALAAELEKSCAGMPAIDPELAAPFPGEDADGDLSIPLEDDPIYDMMLPSETEAPLPLPAARELDATGSLVASDSAGEVVPDLAPPEEWEGGLPPAASAEADVHDIAGAAAASVARFCGLKVIEAVPLELAEEGVVLQRSGGASGRVDYHRVQAIGVAAVKGLVSKPVLLFDLVMNWNDAGEGPLQVIRVRSDAFDVRRLIPQAERSVDAFRALMEQLLARTGAEPLPDRDAVLGRPFRTHPDLDHYQREVLQVAD